MAVIKKKEFLKRLSEKNPSLPMELISAAYGFITYGLKEALAHGRRVSISGFGSFLPRSYHKSPAKRFGLLFHPSAALKARTAQAANSKPDGLE